MKTFKVSNTNLREVKGMLLKFFYGNDKIANGFNSWHNYDCGRYDKIKPFEDSKDLYLRPNVIKLHENRLVSYIEIIFNTADSMYIEEGDIIKFYSGRIDIAQPCIGTRHTTCTTVFQKVVLTEKELKDVTEETLYKEAFQDKELLKVFEEMEETFKYTYEDGLEEY